MEPSREHDDSDPAAEPVFFDVETTGIGKEDRLCQIAFMDRGHMRVGLCKPPVPISPKAAEIHGITQEMVDGLGPFIGSDLFDAFAAHVAAGRVFAAHNAQFDVAMLAKEGIEIPAHVCTLKVARYVDKDGDFAAYNLQFLREFFMIDADATAHDAEGDVIVLEKVYEGLADTLIADASLPHVQTKADALAEMVRISRAPMRYRIFQFGKHRGKTLKSVAAEDPGYLRWLLKEKKAEDVPDAGWIQSLEEALDGTGE